MGLRDRDKCFYYDPVDRRFKARLWRRDVYPRKLAIDVPFGTTYPLTITAAASNNQPAFVFAQPLTTAQGLGEGLGSPFIINSLIFEDSGSGQGTAAANWTVLLKNIGLARQYSNLPLHVRTLMGTAQTPAILREPLFLDDTQQIACYLQKISGAASSARLYLDGTQFATWSTELLEDQGAKAEIFQYVRRWRERAKYVWPYWLCPEQTTGLNAASIVMTSGQTVTVESKISEIAQFEAFGMMAVATGNFSLQLTEVKTNRLIMNGEISQTNAIGTNLFPTLFPTPWLLSAGSKLRWTFTDLSSSGNTAFVTIFGRRIEARLEDVRQVLNDTSVPTPADTESMMVPKPF